MLDDLSILNIQSSLRKLKEKKIGALELTDFFLNRAKKLEALGAYITLDPEQARKEAALADHLIATEGKDAFIKKPLLGVPLAIKDMICTKDLKTTAASLILENFIPPYDATAVAKLKAAGGIILGKTNMDEFAMGSSNENSAFFAACNPWDTSRVPGGSSGGSAVAVAARLALGALGTDTGGSIRQPAAFSGIVGLKPTYGRVSRYGAIAFASSLDQIGPMALNVDDASLLLSIISGEDQHDSTSAAVAPPKFNFLNSENKEQSPSSSIKGLRIGVPKEYMSAAGINPEVEKIIRAALEKFVELGARLVEISLPNTNLALAAYYIIAPAEASSNLARYDGVRYGRRAKISPKDSLFEMYAKSRGEGFGREVRRRIVIGTYVLSSGYYDAYYLQALKARRLVFEDFVKAFQDCCDIIACPTSPTTAFKLNEKTSDPVAMYLNDIYTIPVNLAGLPAISIPCGFDSQKLPCGLQLIGNAWDEERLLKVAKIYESNTGWKDRLPPTVEVLP
ncbi:MAG TPA: Asp-tRNA(Asn)/Glu-tRNA(Gln) amidotransferase subunit GatA [Oligoflexia bacterium]|nr:Asp-tRNA(Asn)/Glu-tRNA(Gln) amidotransferase subunit GatA [Oligoflexia bacterium]HMP27523.1 Asp-tRNA(Asn)/Glu-tRNA(Gln) amidotransferase subunit GatA [Oligoflexia bacterium]